MNMKFILFFLISLAIASCVVQLPQSKPVLHIPKTQEDCVKQRGLWLYSARELPRMNGVGLNGEKYDYPEPPPSGHCVIKTSDAGKICSDSLQCQGLCLARDHSFPSTKKTEGQCAPMVPDPSYGCISLLKNGAQVTTCFN
jgi:hypothetical protein